jgi:precorrin-6B methylase 2
MEIRLYRKMRMCRIGLPLLLAAASCRRSEPPRPAATASSRAAIERWRQPDRLVAALGLRPGDRVADIGAGGGFLTLRLARAVGPGGRVFATDVDGEALAALQARADAEHLGQIEVRRVAPDAPGLEPRCCDVVLLAEVDHLLGDRTAYFRALAPLVRPGGRIVVANRRAFEPAVRAAAAAAALSVEELPLGLNGQFAHVLRVSGP